MTTSKRKTAQSKKSRTTKTRRSKAKAAPRRLWWWVKLLCLVLAGVTLTGVLVVDRIVTNKFEGKKWSVPARVYARPLELYQGLTLSADALRDELQALGYRRATRVRSAGQMRERQGTFDIHSRGFEFWDKRELPQGFRLRLSDGQVAALTTLDGEDLPLVRLEPRKIGGIYPAHMEDRMLVRLVDIPPLLGEALIAVEDRGFLDHYGVSPKAVARAALANMRAAGVVQGGSTLTQQLVKNFYLSHERSLLRKAQEAVMALSLEFHYSKAEILQAYINEVYLGQRGRRGVHGFALAARHYFQQPLMELEVPQLALLVGVVKGASYYNPWRYPERSKTRRDLVLKIMADNGLISPAEQVRATAQPLGVVKASKRSLEAYPAFLDLVKRQLQEHYREEDLRTEGLRIFTSFDPWVQRTSERALRDRLGKLERHHGLSKQPLQGAAVVSAVGSGEVLALVGDRNGRYAGFNRALDARRPIGSLIKPAIYLTALAPEHGYHLASPVSDAPVTVAGEDGSRWQPRNFSRRDHGEVPFYRALARSYNQATARLGMELGLDKVADTLADLGVTAEVPLVPSMLLGSVDMSPMAVATMYHTLATEGVYTPLRAIRAVLAADGAPLDRYPLLIEQRFPAEQVYQLNYALQAVMHEGTGRSAYQRLPRDLRLAGKTGTSNDQRDSWFSGFSGDHLAVVWLGRDDNGKTPLTGSGGALQVWLDLMEPLATRGLDTLPPETVNFRYVDLDTGGLSGENCRGARQLPFVQGREPRERAPCEWIQHPVVHWWKGLWQK